MLRRRAGPPALTTQDHIDIEQMAARYAFLVDTCTAGGGRVREDAERLAFPVAGARVPEPPDSVQFGPRGRGAQPAAPIASAAK